MKSETVRLIALGRKGSRQVYGTRRLVAGDEFEMPRENARALIAVGLAKLAGGEPAPRPSPPKPPAPPAPPQPEPDEPPVSEPDEKNELASLRAQARELGIDVDGRWGPARLNYEISRKPR